MGLPNNDKLVDIDVMTGKVKFERGQYKTELQQSRNKLQAIARQWQAERGQPMPGTQLNEQTPIDHVMNRGIGATLDYSLKLKDELGKMSPDERKKTLAAMRARNAAWRKNRR